MDAADRAEVVIEKEMDCMIAKSQRRLQGNNQTGACVDCDGMIPMDRMAALPGCARCVACQNEIEGS
ncbi:MAG: TraR/DksA C4-type zinc finger protein [Emcibacter sp.]|nr:TraR/DksA C4-type zinc finger protein [Emcibacter sp.]